MKIDRINKICKLIKEVHSISIDDLCATFNVSKNTIRRDISELEKNGVIKKIYGGIVLQESSNTSPEPFTSRKIKHPQEKQKIAKIASTLVNDGDIIYIDSGTTTMHMIPYLATKKNITIITTSVHVINASLQYDNFNIIATGGSLYKPSLAFVGPSVLNCLKKYNISKAFMASTGISIEKGATNASPLECEIKKFLMQKECQKILVVDNSKLDVASLMTYANLSDFNCVIMDQDPSAKYVTYFKKNNITLLSELNIPSL